MQRAIHDPIEVSIDRVFGVSRSYQRMGIGQRLRNALIVAAGWPKQLTLGPLG